MENTIQDSKQLFKILLGAAWIDGEIQPAERDRLQRKASELGLDSDPEIQALLNDTHIIPAADCYDWLEAYLGSHPAPEDYQKLLEEIGATVYSDGDIGTSEADLLAFMQSVDPAAHEQTQPRKAQNALLKAIQGFYRQATSALN